MRRALFAAALFAATPALAETSVNLTLDEVHTLTFKKPVATVYVGNPAIADITMIDARHAFVQGKAYGRTNIVALNPDGVQVFGSAVNVTGGRDDSTVTLNRGAQRITYNCAGERCEPAPVLGDSKDAFESAVNQINTHQSAARTAAQAASGK